MWKILMGFGLNSSRRANRHRRIVAYQLEPAEKFEAYVLPKIVMLLT